MGTQIESTSLHSDGPFLGAAFTVQTGFPCALALVVTKSLKEACGTWAGLLLRTPPLLWASPPSPVLGTPHSARTRGNPPFRAPLLLQAPLPPRTSAQGVPTFLLGSKNRWQNRLPDGTYGPVAGVSLPPSLGGPPCSWAPEQPSRLRPRHLACRWEGMSSRGSRLMLPQGPQWEQPLPPPSASCCPVQGTGHLSGQTGPGVALVRTGVGRQASAAPMAIINIC